MHIWKKNELHDSVWVEWIWWSKDNHRNEMQVANLGLVVQQKEERGFWLTEIDMCG